MGHVQLGVFSPSVVLGVAAATGALRAAGLSVVDVPAASSAQQIPALLAGELDAVLTSPDNVLAYRSSATDLRILATIDRGLGLSLFAGPCVDLDGLRGRVLAVDALTSGFAFVAYELLARAGLRAGDDVEVRSMGSTPRRASALLAGECGMTLLGSGLDLRAEAAGCVRLGRARSLGPYVGTVLAAVPTTSNTAPLRALTTVLVSTARALVAGEFGAEATAVAAATLQLDSRDVQRYLATLADPGEGLVPDGRMDAASLATLCRLRACYSPGTDLSTVVKPGGGLIDEAFLSGAEPS